MDEFTREPCPYRIIDDAGSAFSMGLVGGSIFHSFKGWRSAPKGQAFVNMAREVRTRSPLTGVQFAAWGGMFSTIDCCMVYIRKKEDPWNSIISGAATGALLAVRSGPAIMVASGALGAIVLAAIEGVSMGMNRLMSPAFDQTKQIIDMQDPKNIPAKQASSSNNTVDVNFDNQSSPLGGPLGLNS
ncbi:tim17/Tim22/Tim23/Pmp24 family domain-containing protein [Ditylenchus destructor]|nr:tim17/Tim22/Tim23/Pmp24 family domain-containing protein [Ditylenchus destructor]